MATGFNFGAKTTAPPAFGTGSITFGTPNAQNPTPQFSLGGPAAQSSPAHGFQLGGTPTSTPGLFGTNPTGFKPAPTNLSFGTPAAAPTGNLSFGTPAAAPNFGTPGAIAPNLSFGAPSAAPNVTSAGLFGTPTSVPSQGLTFGTPATSAPSQGLTFGTPASSAPSQGLTFGTPASSAPSQGLTFGTPASSAPSQGLTFGTPASSAPTQGLAFGAPASAAPVQGLTFGAPASSAAPNFGFGTSTAAPTVPTLNFGASASTAGTTATTGLTFAGVVSSTPSTGLSFGTTPGASTAGGLFGSTSGTTSAGLSFGVGSSITTAAPSLSFGTATTAAGGLSFGLGTSAPGATGLTFGGTTTSAAPPAATITSSALTGLGGVATSQAKTAVTTQKEIPSKDQPLPNEILQTVQQFKDLVKQQKLYSSDIARCSVRDFRKVEQEIDLLNNLTNEVECQLQKNRHIAEKLKYDTAKCLQNVEMAQRTQDTPPGLQYENTAPSWFFLELVDQFEKEMHAIKVQIDSADKYVKSHKNPESLAPQDLAMGMRRLHDTFVALAGRLQSVHNQVESQKEMFINLRKHILNDSTNPFEKFTKQTDLAANLKKSLIYSPPKIASGPTPFSNLALSNGNANLQQSNPPPPAYPTTTAPPGYSSGLTFGSTPMNQPANTGLFGGSTTFGQTAFQLNNSSSFQLQKPPTGNKRGKQ